VLKPFGDPFNTIDDSLKQVYVELVGEGPTVLRPFEESAETVTASTAGEFDPLLRQ